MRDLTIPFKHPSYDFDDTAMLEWISEYADNIIYLRPTPEHNGAWCVYFNNSTRKIRSEVSLRDAIEGAMKIFQEENE